MSYQFCASRQVVKLEQVLVSPGLAGACGGTGFVAGSAGAGGAETTVAVAVRARAEAVPRAIMARLDMDTSNLVALRDALTGVIAAATVADR